MIHAYTFDGTADGFFTAVFDAYKDKDAFICGKGRQIAFDETEIPIETDGEKSARVKRKLVLYDRNSLRDVDYILRSDGLDRENAAFLYIRRICANKGPVREMFADADVFYAQTLIRKVGWETDKFRGFIRFAETESGILYAPFAPDCDITAIIVNHFISRFRREKFVIHDVKRNIAAVYNGKDCIITPFSDPDLYLSDDEEEMQKLWKEYYRSVNIAGREHLKQMRGYMPVRYWKYLPEKH